MAMRLLVTGAAGMLGSRVVEDARRLGHDVVALGHGDLDLTDTANVARIVTAAGPQAIVNCAAWTDVDGAEAHEARALRVNGEGAGDLARVAATIDARLIHVSTDYVFDGDRAQPWLESDPVAPLQAYGRTKLAGELAIEEAGANHAIVRAAWLFGVGGPNFVDTMLRLGAERDEVQVVTDQRGRPTWTGHLAPALIELAERRGDLGTFHATGSGECTWYEFAVEIFDQAGVRCRVVPTTSESFQRPAQRPAYSVLGTEREPGVVLPPWTGRPGRSPRRARGAGGMRLLVCGGAGFIGSAFVRQRVAEHGDDVVVLDKLTYAGRRENLRDVEHVLVHGAVEDPARVAEAIDGADAVVNFAAETHVDRSIAEPDAFVRTHAPGTYVLLEAVRERGLRYVQVSTDEVYGSIEEGSFTEASPLNPSSPYSATKAGADLLVSGYVHTYGLDALICRGSNNYGPRQYPEKLIPLMVLNALHGDPLPVYGDGHERAQLAVRGGLRARHRPRPGPRPGGRGLQRRRPRRVREHRCRAADHRAGGRRRVAHRVRHRPTRPRPALLAELGQGARAGLGAAGAPRRGARAHRRLVPRQRVVVGADPLGRLPRVLRAPVRARAALIGRLSRRSRCASRCARARTPGS